MAFASILDSLKMFQLFLRARAQDYFRSRLSDDGFNARSAERNAETDRSRVGRL